MNAIIFGASGGLASALTDVLLERRHHVDLVTRENKREQLQHRYAGTRTARVLAVNGKYSGFQPSQAYDAYFFTQALFTPQPLTAMSESEIASELEVGLAEPIRLTRKLLLENPPSPGDRRNYCFVGSTSAYAGFRNTSTYCAVKHGLLGFVRAMNDEYGHTDARFWLFSMGTMNTEMGIKVPNQDPSSFLQPRDVAERMVEAIGSPSNLFEPEVIIRRRTVRFLES